MQAPQEGGLAAAGRADDGNHFPFVDGLIHAGKHVEVAKALMQIHCFNHFHQIFPP